MLFNERLDTFSSVENKETEEQDRQSKINSLIMKYGRKKVAAEKKKSEERERKTGKKTTWSQFKYNLENKKGEKGKDPKGVRFYDKKGSGYIKDGKKKYKRYFVIKQLKEIEENPIIPEMDCSKNTLNVGKECVEKHI